ncbi:MAG: type II toxin-antitoxin system PemK/MazF family toxin [Phycisphaerae bacterium]|nr:type II toxin-antitoxin system PemK/MazF family toxin [Phycisphaerae bacterium]NUQ45068.1 type II toxin-antitoxin system PemK/MazF family toxin [Phycisphaerae bacterium]
MPFEPGQLLLVSFPFTDRTTAKLRPALVVSGAEFKRGDDFVAVPLSSRPRDDVYDFPITSSMPFFKQSGLKQDSIVKWSKPMTISTAVAHRKLGRIPDEVMFEINKLIRSLFPVAPES